MPPLSAPIAALAQAVAAVVAVVVAAAALLAPQQVRANDIEQQSRALRRAADAVVGLRAQAVEDARSAATLGPEREGSGVVIGDDGLVLTIGYLILEADQVLLVTDDAREVPARVVAYDVATGFGLVQALAPLKLAPAPLGQAARLQEAELLMIASGGARGAVSVATLVVRRPFSGYWEYHLDEAVFTTPPRTDHSGAGLFNGRGELVGIGSLVVSDAGGPNGPRVPGNMFVPVDLLASVMAELRSRGTSRASERAWIGVNCVETELGVRVLRVSPDSPADVAGLEVGDKILAIDGAEVGSLAALWMALWSGGRPEREVALQIERGGAQQTIKVQTVDRMKTLRRAQGV
jgi:S1-C subfamily serine protease